MEFTQESAQKIFGGEIKEHVLLFLSKKAEDFLSLVNSLKEVAPSFRGQVWFVKVIGGNVMYVM